jgi:predicted DNA-binding WGR domain protein
MIPIHLERREPARNRQRFYAITVTRTRGLKSNRPKTYAKENLATLTV